MRSAATVSSRCTRLRDKYWYILRSDSLPRHLSMRQAGKRPPLRCSTSRTLLCCSHNLWRAVRHSRNLRSSIPWNSWARWDTRTSCNPSLASNSTSPRLLNFLRLALRHRSQQVRRQLAWLPPLARFLRLAVRRPWQVVRRRLASRHPWVRLHRSVPRRWQPSPRSSLDCRPWVLHCRRSHRGWSLPWPGLPWLRIRRLSALSRPKPGHHRLPLNRPLQDGRRCSLRRRLADHR